MSKKKGFFYFLKELTKKLKQNFPDIIKPNFYIYHILVFYLYPGGKEQQMHRDTFYFGELEGSIKDKTVDSLQVFISLHR